MTNDEQIVHQETLRGIKTLNDVVAVHCQIGEQGTEVVEAATNKILELIEKIH